jgi:hypothetical protein
LDTDIEVVENDFIPTEDTGPDEFGQAEVTDQPAPEVLEVDQFANHVVRVKVDGEDLEVPLTEALSGYQRQADYTRKTQELAQQRQEIEYWQTLGTAMERNPEGTLRWLQEQYGIAEGSRIAAQAESQVEDDDDLWADPYEQKLAELDRKYGSMFEQWEAQQAQQYLDTVVSGLSQKYGEDFKADEVISAAIQRGIFDPNALEMVYKDIAFDRLMGRTAAQAEAGKQKQAQEEARRQAAATAVSTVTAGASVANTTLPSADRPMTVAEAYALAKQQHGLI